jgi:O-antigen/teichoic acid export membrane protein
MKTGDARVYRVGRTATTTLIARVVTITVSIVSVPLILHEVGATRFGLWSTITSAVALLNLADLGIGNSLLNAVTSGRARGDERGTIGLVSTATFAFVAIAGVLLVALVVATLTVDWSQVFRVTSTRAASEAAPTFFVVGLAVVFALPLSVSSKVQLAFQEGYVTQLWGIGGQLAALAALLIAVADRASLPVIAGCGLLVPVAAQAGNSVQMFAGTHRDLRPRKSAIDSAVAHNLLSGGALFMFLQLSWTAAFASDNLIIDRILGSAAVTGYAVPYRAFTAVATLAVLPLAALWPAYTDAAVRHDWPWLRRSVARTVTAMTSIGVALAVLALFTARPLLAAWIGKTTKFSTPLLVGFSIWILLFCVGNALGLYFNALGVLRFQVVTVAAMVVANIVLSIVFVRAWGISGAIYGSVVSYTVIVVGPYAWYLRRHLREMSARAIDGTQLPAASSAISSNPLP